MKLKINLLLFTFIFLSMYTLVRILTFLIFLVGFKYWFPKKKSVIFFENFPIENAGYQYRAKKWVDILNQNNIQAKVITTISSKYKFETLLRDNYTQFLIISLLKRTYQVFLSVRYKTVIVRRELLYYNDYGNLFLDKLLLVLHTNVVLDFDDDISASKEEPRRLYSLYSKIMIENGSKFIDSLKLYNKFIVGSSYLKDFVLTINPEIAKEKICVIPTCVDYENHSTKKYSNVVPNPLTLGWIGGVGNLKLLESIFSQLNKLNDKYPIKLLIISGKEISADVNFEIENIIWNYETQIRDILKMDIGLMPLFDTELAKGKCGFKLIQYMGLGIVSVASAITVNKEIIDDGKNGFLILPQKNDWSQKLENIIKQYPNFSTIGQNAKKTIIKKYSFIANQMKYIEFISN